LDRSGSDSYEDVFDQRLTGMRLAGVDGIVVHERDELKEAIEKAMSDPEIGIVLLTEKFGREFPELIDEIKLERKMPLLIEIPDRHGTGRKKDFITSYVNEAIGLKL
jgi:V/A-type H+-transporting ATPase subunit F